MMPSSRLPSVPFLLLVAALATPGVGCLNVVQPADVNVLVDVVDVPDGKTLEVELTDVDGTVRHLEPRLASSVTVAFTLVKAGDITVTAVVYGAGHDALARAFPLHDKATSARKTFRLSFREQEEPDAGSPDAGEPPDAGGEPDAGGTPDAGQVVCVDFDPAGFACPTPFAPLAAPADALVPLGSYTAPALLVVSQAGHEGLLVRAGQPDVRLAGSVEVGAVLVAADGSAALVPTGDPKSGWEVTLVRADGGLVTVGGQAMPGHFGFLRDGTAWALDGPDPLGFGKLRLVRPGEKAPAADLDVSCRQPLRGPIALAAQGADFQIFEGQSEQPAIVLVAAGGKCLPVALADPSQFAMPGSWSAPPDGHLFHMFSMQAGDWESFDDVTGAVSPFAPGAQKPDGVSALLPDGRIVYGSRGALLAYDASRQAFMAIGEMPGVVEFAADEGQKPLTLARTKDGLLGVIAFGGSGRLYANTSLGVWPRLAAADGSAAVVWEPMAQSAGAWLVTSSFTFKPLGEGPPGAARPWVTGGRELLVVGLLDGLYDAASGKKLVDTPRSLAWGVVGKSLALVDAGKRAMLLPSPGAAVVPLSPDPVDALAVTRDGTGFWLARTTGDLVRVGLPRGVTP